MGIQKDIDVFLYRAQKRTALLGSELLVQEDKGNCIDDYIDTIIDLDNAIYLLQNRPTSLSDDEVYEVISYLNKKGELTKLPLSLYSFTCGVENVVLPGGYVAGPIGPEGEKGEKGDPGDDGAAGAAGAAGTDGDDGWTAISSIVADGERRVVFITGWTGGTGTPPASDVYVGDEGFVNNIEDAADIRGAQGAQGDDGDQGEVGEDGVSSYVYIGYADDDIGTGFTSTFDETKDYIAIRSSAIEISPVVASTFNGLWKQYKGETGDAFEIDAQGPLVDRTTYDAEAKGFTFLDHDNGDIYIKRSSFPGDWSDPFPFIGYTGWSPLLANVADSDRIVQQIVGWTGGEGAEPDATNLYIGPIGIVNTPGEAQDIRGLQGERFFPDAEGDIADISDYDTEDMDFIYHAVDEGKVYIKLSDVSGDWSDGFTWRGEQGVAGPIGPAGSGSNASSVVATTADLSATYSSGTLEAGSDGVLTIDGITLAINDRVLVKNQANAEENGIYIATDLGSVSTHWILTRAEDFNSTLEAQKFLQTFIEDGTVNQGTKWGMTNDRPALLLDTTLLVFTQDKPSFSNYLERSGGTLTGALVATTLQTAAGGAITKAIAIGGAGTGVWRDTGLDGLKWIVNSVNVFWMSDSGVIAKAPFTAEADVTLLDGINFIFDSTTGTKIGTASSQKIGLWNATPIVQPTTGIAAATFAANTSGIVNDTATFDGYTIGQVVKALRNTGLLA